MATLTSILISPGIYEIHVAGTIIPGTLFRARANTGIGGTLHIVLSVYTSFAADDFTDVVTGLYGHTDVSYRAGQFAGSGYYIVDLGVDGSLSALTVTEPTPPPPSLPTSSISYGQIFNATFSPVEIQPVLFPQYYLIEIFKKNYSGAVRSLDCSAIPVLQKWDTDDPKAPVKGSSLTLRFVVDKTFTIKNFYADEDDTFRVRFSSIEKHLVLSPPITRILFEGYLVQDDCQEILIDSNHEIQLSATDNLGLLKEVPFNQAKENYSLLSTSTGSVSSSTPHTLNVPQTVGNTLNIDDQVDISGGSSIDGRYTVRTITAGNPTVLTVDEVIGSTGATSVTIQVYRVLLSEKKSLSEIIKACLLTTGLSLQTNIFSQIRETTQDASRSFFDQTLIEATTLMKNDNEWESCYDVLTNLFKRFRCTLFQALGSWNIIRWDELRYTTDYKIPGFIYDEKFSYVGTTELDPVFVAGKDEITYPEYGYLNRIFRNFRYTKETFNFKQQNEFLKNSNLSHLGTLLRNYTNGQTGANFQAISEYSIDWWTSLNSANAFIRVIKDQFQNEIDRFIVIKDGVLGQAGEIKSYKMEVNQNDQFTLSFRIRTDKDYINSATIKFQVELTDGIQTQYVINYLPIAGEPPGDPRWFTSPGWKVTIKTFNEYQQVDITGPSIPFDGLMYLYLPHILLPDNLSRETWYKDISIDMTFLVNQSAKVTRQTHTSTQPLQIKNKQDDEVYMDSSIKNSIAGTLFLNSMTGLLQRRADRWTRNYVGEDKRLGEITTFEALYWRRIQRTILEGKLHGLIQNSIHVSMRSVFSYSELPGVKFVFGRMEIDYRNRTIDGTLWENNEDSELQNDVFSHDYSFDYLYAAK